VFKRLLFLVPAIVMGGELLAQGCAMCKAVVGQEEESGINSGILWLIPVPYILLFLLFRKQLHGFWRELVGSRG
jgi:hypothetical protein